MDVINDWRPELQSLLARLRKYGIKITHVDNGDEAVAMQRDWQVLREIEATDQSHVYCDFGNGTRGWLFIVLGNSPGEIVCDYSVHPILRCVCEEHADEWEGREQPKKLRKVPSYT